MKDVETRPVVSTIPTWELNTANFDIDYTTLKKDDGPIVSAIANSHIEENYNAYLKVAYLQTVLYLTITMLDLLL